MHPHLSTSGARVAPRLLLSVVLVVVVALQSAAGAAGAATFTVNRTDDPDTTTGMCTVVPEPANSCSLREAATAIERLQHRG